MEKLRGRPNQGKTETIRERCVNVYLPTKDLVQEWKDDAAKAGMPVSRYVLEVVERHRHSQASSIAPNWQLEEQAKDLASKLAALQSKYDILNLAFQRREEDARRLSEALEKAKAGVDVEVTRKLVEIYSKANGDTVSALELTELMDIDHMADEEIAKVRDANAFLEQIGLIEPDGFIGRRWKVGGKKRPELSAAAKAARHRRRH